MLKGHTAIYGRICRVSQDLCARIDRSPTARLLRDYGSLAHLRSAAVYLEKEGRHPRQPSRFDRSIIDIGR
jgi:hypothetical protein